MTKDFSPIADDLAEASWSSADVALAAAWRDMRRMIGLIENAKPRKGSQLQIISDESDLVRQSLDRAVRLRGLVQLGAAGAVERFDASRHESLDGQRPRGGVLVSILAPGLARVIDNRYDIVAYALVQRVNPPKPRTFVRARGADARLKKPDPQDVRPSAMGSERRERVGQ
jgi:hypothetical protein